MTFSLTRKEMEQELSQAFSRRQVLSLVEVLDTIRRAEVERAADTRELKQGLSALTTEVRNLTQAQQETTADVRQLAVGQQQLTTTVQQLGTTVQELAAGQQQLAHGHQQLTAEVRQLAAGQQQLTATVQQLAAGQQQLTTTVQKLAAGQQQLTHGHKQLTAEVRQLAGEQRKLAQAQQKTELSMVELSKAVGGLANAFGFSLEEFVAALLPPYLEKRYGIAGVRLERRYFDLGKGWPKEVDLVGDGQRDDQPITVLVECRSKVGGSEVRRLADKLTAVAETLGKTEVAKVIVAMNVHPSAEPAASEKGVWIIPYSRINRERG